MAYSIVEQLVQELNKKVKNKSIKCLIEIIDRITIKYRCFETVCIWLVYELFTSLC